MKILLPIGKGYTIPLINQYPGTAKFLKDEWWQFDVSTLSGKLLDYRNRKGLSAKEFCILLGVDLSPVRSWKLKQHKPNGIMLEKLNSILETKQPLD